MNAPVPLDTVRLMKVDGCNVPTGVLALSRSVQRECRHRYTAFASTALAVAVVLLILAPTALAQGKLYRWVGSDGKTHYSDDLPQEALTQARQELSKTNGMTLRQVDRARTPEEIAAAQAKVDADAKAAEAMEKARQSDQMLLSSYPTEADLKHAYDDRFGQVAENLKSTRMGLDGQQHSLSSLLTAASNMELAGKPVTIQLATSIKNTHGVILDQQRSESREEAEAASLQQEAAKTLEHYRELHNAAAHAADAPASPAASPAEASPPKG